MKIILKTVQGLQIPMEVSETIKIFELKDKIAAELSVPA